MESSSQPAADGSAATDDHHPDKRTPPLHPVAQKAYDRYGVLDPVTLDLMVRGIFISREDAASLPSRITADGRPELNSLHGSHHQRPPRSQASSSSHAVVSLARAAVVPPSSSAAALSAAGRTDISATPSDHEKWGEGEVEMIIRMRADRVGFRYIAERFPSKNQKAVQEKFYKSIKDQRDPRWKRLYHELRTRHDRRASNDKAAAYNDNNDNTNNTGTMSDPIEVGSDDSVGTIAQPIEISSGTVSETTTVVAEEEEVEERPGEDGRAVVGTSSENGEDARHGEESRDGSVDD